MKNTHIIAVTGCLLILAAARVTGCTGSMPATAQAVSPVPTLSPAPAPSATALPGPAASPTPGTTVPTLFVNSTSNGKIITIPAGERVLVRLAENPTTGYTWNATASKGLDIVSDTYTAPQTGLMGAPGYHEWILAPKTVNTYKFSAVSLRPWVGAQATDEKFSIVILVTKN